MVAPVAAFAVMQGAGMVLGAIGGMRSSRAARAEARRRQALANLNAQRRAASGQQAGFEEERQARLVQSRALAVAAASGASPSRGSSERVIADIGAEGAYRAALQVYEAEEDARMIRMGGQLEASALRDQARATEIGTIANVFSGAASMYSRYGGDGPKAGSGTDGAD